MTTRSRDPQRPRLANDLPLSSDIVPTNDLDLFQVAVQGDFSDGRFPGLKADEVHISQASFVGADLARSRLVDVLVERSDFSGAVFEEASFTRVAFVDCRMSGVQIALAQLHDVRFTECKLEGANLRMTEAERLLFDHVALRNAEFSTARLSSTSFFDCDLDGADFSQSVTPGARFHGSSVVDINGGEYLKDITIDSSQVHPLALGVFSGLGIRVDDDRDAMGS